jgi:BirA family biotin operon repressor/biotin-[acetyl-CoA-carboxylase] ligase
LDDVKTLLALPLVAAFLILDTLATDLGLGEVALKWPNDLVVDGGKLGGVLLESRFNSMQVVSALGVGVNLTKRAPGLEFETRSLSELVGECDFYRLRKVVLEGYLSRLGKFLDGEMDLEDLIEQAKAKMETIGRQVRVQVGEEEVIGMASDLDPVGRLIVTWSGNSKSVSIDSVSKLNYV